MRAGLLFSGGTDSTLAAMLLDRLYDVTLVTTHVGKSTDWRYAEETSELLGFSFEAVEIEESSVEDAVEQIRGDGNARRAIQILHIASLEAIAERDFDAIADGTRRGDRVPTVPRAQAQQLEDRFSVDYVAPLSGFGPRAVDRLVDTYLEVTSGPSHEINRPDYEAELRKVCAERDGLEQAAALFPSRRQTAVTDLRSRMNEQVEARDA